MLPYAHYPPTFSDKRFVCFSVTLGVALELLGPVLGISARFHAVLWTSMPETPVDEQQHVDEGTASQPLDVTGPVADDGRSTAFQTGGERALGRVRVRCLSAADGSFVHVSLR